MSKLDDIKSSESKSFKKLNPHIFGQEAEPGLRDAVHHRIEEMTKEKPSKPKRIRQSEKPLLNKLEGEWFERIRFEFPNYPRPKPQAVKLKIAGSAFYKPDFFVTSWPHVGGPAQPTAWEVKGMKGKNIDRGKLALKVAATAWPEIKFILVWKDEAGQWQEQHVLP